MPVEEVRPGMHGYGLTVFRGTKLERFNVEVVGVMPKANMGEPLVLVRLSGGPITARGAYLIQGMSGSPIYINGKLLGAFSQGDSWPKEPLGMVTPIHDMLEALDPKLPPVPAGATAQDNTFDLPVMASAETQEGGIGIFRGPEAAAINAAGRSFHQLALPVSVGGFSQRNLERAAQVLQPFNMSVMQGPGGMAEPFKAELSPGAGVGVVLLSGDVDMSAIGTVTYRQGDDLLAFGHPMMQVGAAQFPISSVWVHDVFPGMPVSYKIGSAGELKGTLTQDRPFSIAAKVGPLPSMIPIRCSVNDMETGRSRTFNVRAANHPLLVGQLLPLAVNQGLFQVRPVPGDTVARVKLAVETDGAGTISRENVFFDPSSIDVLAIRELQELMGLLANNSFRRVPIKSLNVDVTYESGRPTATVDRIFLPQDKFEPGDEVEVGVVMRPYRKEPVVTKTKIRIPENASNGRAMLLVQGGSTRVNVLPPVTAGGGLGIQQSAPPDASLRQVLKRFTNRERNDEIVTRLLFPTTAVNIKGERLSQLPSTILNVMRSSKTTGLRVERDETKVRTHSDYLCDGVQTLEITIEKKDHTEKSSTAPGRLGAGGSGTLTLPGTLPTRGTLSAGDDLEDLNTVNFTVDGKPRMVRLSPMPTPHVRVPLTLTPEEEEDGDTISEPKTDAPRASEPKSEKPSGDKEKPTKGKSESRKTGKAGAKSESTPPSTGSTTPTKSEDSSKSESSEDDKILGRPVSHWTQSSQRDFEAGTLQNTAVSSSGEVRLAPGLKLQYESPEQYVWSVLGMGGAVFAGTGNTGQVLKVDGEGKGSVFFRTGELEVHALAKDPSGNLYAGTSPNGKIFKIAPDGQGKEIFSMNGDRSASDPDVGGKFVLSMSTAPDGTLYAGTGPEGRIYRLRPGSEKPEELCRISDQSITSLLATADGTLYAGTAEDGALYKIHPAEAGSKPTVVYETNQAAITGIAVDGAGKLYIACAPSGDIYQIEADGTPRIQFDKVRAPVYSLLSDPTGNLYAAAADSILRIEPGGVATILSDEKKGQFTSLAWDEGGRLVAGSVNVGSVYRLQPSLTGSFESTVHDAKVPARWGRIRYAGVLPSGATLVVKTRSGNTPEPGATWSDWSTPVAREGGMYSTSPMARFLQYRVELAGTQSPPALREISIAYLRNNQAPKLTLASPGGGEIWKGSQTLRWSALDPDSDTLTYQLSYSSDSGRTWKPVGESAEVKEKVGPTAGTPPTPDKEAVSSALERYKKQLDDDNTLSAQDRTDRYQRAKTMIDNYMREHPPTASAAPAVPARPETPAATRPAGITRQATFAWDTKQIPDGIYVLRVIASDQASNPTGALSDTQVSEPFIIANTPPQVFLLEQGATAAVAQSGDTGKMQTVSGFAAGRVSLKGAQFRLADGDWTALEAEDGLWDSAFEHFRARFPAIASGEQSLEVKVVDVAGNVQVTKVKVGPAGVIGAKPPVKAPETIEPTTPAPTTPTVTEEQPGKKRKSRKK